MIHFLLEIKFSKIYFILNYFEEDNLSPFKSNKLATKEQKSEYLTETLKISININTFDCLISKTSWVSLSLFVFFTRLEQINNLSVQLSILYHQKLNSF